MAAEAGTELVKVVVAGSGGVIAVPLFKRLGGWARCWVTWPRA